MKKLAILGAGGHGKVVADTAALLGYTDIHFFDAVWPARTENCVWPIRGTEKDLFAHINEFDAITVAIGNNKTRLDFCLQIKETNHHLVTLIHPTAYVSQHTVIGDGTVVFANAVINPGSSIGLAGIISTSATVDHDCIIGNSVHISPGVHIAGEVQIGDRSWIGIGSAIKHQIKIGADVMVGAGAAVVSDIPDRLTVVGVPAKKIKGF